MKIKALAILETMWGTPGKAPGMFRINPQNHTGRRLYWLLGHRDLWCTNCCRDQVANAKQHGKPDIEWLRENLARVEPELILVCGNVAQNSFDAVSEGDWPNCRVIYMPHPAWRGWTKQMLEEYRTRLQELSK